jgi:hypothetical protein
MGDHVEKRGSTGSQILKEVLCSYCACLKLMVIEQVEEMNNCTVAQKFGFIEENVRCYRNKND